MTLEELQSLVHYSTKKDLLLGAFSRLANDGLRQIQRQRSFLCMESTIAVVIPDNANSVDLPATFKEPQRGKTPLRGQCLNETNGPRYIPWTLWSKQEYERLLAIGYNVTDRKAYMYLNAATGNQTLVVCGEPWMNPNLSSKNFMLDSYSFLPDLVNPTDTNFFLTNFPQMVIEKTLELAFALDGDEESTAFRSARYKEQYQSAILDDASRQNSGRVLRMGGY